MIDEKTRNELTKKTLGISSNAYKYAKVIYAYCTKECVSEDLYELAPVMKQLKTMVEDMHINMLMLAGEENYEGDMVSEYHC